MSTGATKKLYYGIFNEDPKIIAMRLERPKAPMPVYNLNKFYKIINNYISLTQVNNPKNLSILN